MRYHLGLLILCASTLPAQSNVIPGTDVRLTLIEDPWYFGRRGPAHPNGEISIAYSYYVCNVGTTQIPWEGPFNGLVNNQPGLRPNHPFWAFMVVREGDGRMVQVNNNTTYVKHASSAANSASRCTGCTPSGTSTLLGVGCGDAYGQNTNSNRFWLGPPEEIDPWLCTWQPVGSYFDRGDPEVPPPANTDQIRSLTDTQLAAFDSVKNRVTLQEADLLTPGRFYYCMHMLVKGEPAASRLDNFGYREMTCNWDGSVWSFANAGNYAFGSPLNSWPGASVTSGRNGNDDGTFYVGVKVTGPVAGLYHYEYAVHNFDNERGAAGFHVPLCPNTPLANVGFRDIDANPLNDWTWSRVGDELVFAAAANNALQWNQLFNFWFDCGTPPLAGSVALDEALPGTGALQVGVDTMVPDGSALVANLGPGCGTPSPAISGNGLPTLGNQNFGISFATSPNAGLFLFVGFQPANVPIAPTCSMYLGGLVITEGFLLASPTGTALFPVPVPNSVSFDGYSLYWQAAQLLLGGPVFGQLSLSNGLQTRIGCH